MVYALSAPMAEGQRRLCWDPVFIVGAVALRGSVVLYFTGHGWFPVESSHRLMSHRPYMWNRGFVRDMLENSDRKYIFLSTPHGFPTDTETALVTLLSILHSCRSPCFASPFWDQSIFPLVFYFQPRGWWLSVSWALHALLLCYLPWKGWHIFLPCSSSRLLYPALLLLCTAL